LCRTTRALAQGGPRTPKPRRPRRAEFSWDCLEERTVLSQIVHHANLGTAVAVGSGSTSTSSAKSTAVAGARQALRAAVLAVETKSGTTVAQLSAIETAFRAVRADRLAPGSRSALTTFENSLVTAGAAGAALPTLAAFEALFTGTPTAQQTTDLTAAYNALTAAVTSSNITSADITSVTTAYNNFLTAVGSTSTAAYPLISLVTGQGGGHGEGGRGDRGGHEGGGGGGHHGDQGEVGTPSTAASAAIQALRTAVRAIEARSGVTVGDLTAITTAFGAVRADGLTPGSRAALTAFEDTLVRENAAGTLTADSATLLTQFEALDTATPTAQQTTDLTTAFNALVTAVAHSNITSADITTITTDYANVLAAEGSTSTATFPLSSLVTGRGGRGGFGGGGC